MHGTYSERGVSEVLGVVLMVAITVLLAATAASMFLGFQDELDDSAPAIAVDHNFFTDDGSQVLKVEHDGGDTIDPEEIRIVVHGLECGGDERGTRFTSAGLGVPVPEITAGWQVELSRTTLCHSGDLDLSEANVAVVWVSSDGSSSQTLWQWRGPTA